MDWRDIPSLSALRAFEAAARLGSFSAAARELSVTHAAVAQHVRGLEADFGVSLLEREGRGVAATSEGQALARSLSEGFSTVAAGVRSLRLNREGGPITVSVTAAFAETWLMPRLGRFWSAYPDIALAIRADDAVVDLKREGVDVAVRFGRGDGPGLQMERLLPLVMVAVGRPQFADTKMPRQHWFVAASWPESETWARSLDLIDDDTRITVLPDHRLTLAATTAGHGISVQTSVMAGAHLETGDLVSLCEETEETLAYHIVTLPGPMRPEVRTFVRWMRNERD